MFSAKVDKMFLVVQGNRNIRERNNASAQKFDVIQKFFDIENAKEMLPKINSLLYVKLIMEVVNGTLNRNFRFVGGQEQTAQNGFDFSIFPGFIGSQAQTIMSAACQRYLDNGAPG